MGGSRYGKQDVQERFLNQNVGYPFGTKAIGDFKDEAKSNAK